MRGPKEDEAFGLDSFLYKNLRRGNTLVEFKNKEEEKKVVIARKGLNKFFDISLESIVPETRYNDINAKASDFGIKNY